MTNNDETLARKVIALLDLTSLNDTDDDARIVQLCHKAMTAVGPVAAVCVFPRFVALARRTLDRIGGQGVAVATVCNFPAGTANLPDVLAEIRQALEDGASEIDVVYPYRALLAGDAASGFTLVAACKALCEGRALLKVILETGELNDPVLIRNASQDAIAAGADFIKTSTGKVKVNATAEAAQIMLACIADSDATVGFKPAGGMATLAQALVYLWLAERLLGSQWVGPRHLRFGASSLLDDLLRKAGHEPLAPTQGGY
ncbi:deoxyribose-phosphate aldolase [Stutzerimonas kirkiae]|uniref:Deoxyribose-phosphate aldolase n=1 Tax=Stutzerimonas kirkiae TaxID=2211392 RepID=A0A4Q9R5H2_9GAMM|nr:deoxyribose-phosphate aldolase [Stutzerimonas kirkiae]TBU95786.1 deoxyribose-phosphate aldolase [Stutzerimonas kirkiae]TBV02777.1 deoxyribose-phosphate aldolase [Stutzerimonas kirkiae]TBV03729.1 deoxyribose-phosphate aldolase [Stutzerimonas kirkiae]TBV13290.1 deoxyribose-phosphate aldolase [Stutzerimonas kirkiae]